MCYAMSNREMAEVAYNNEQAGQRGWVLHIKAMYPVAYGIYLELKRDSEFQRDVAAALAAGWPSDEDLAGLDTTERTALLVSSMS